MTELLERFFRLKVASSFLTEDAIARREQRIAELRALLNEIAAAPKDERDKLELNEAE